LVTTHVLTVVTVVPHPCHVLPRPLCAPVARDRLESPDFRAARSRTVWV